MLIRIRSESPLFIELAGTPLVLWTIYWVLRHPEEIGQWLPQVVAGWRRGWSKAYIAQKELDLASRYRTWLQQQGRAAEAEELNDREALRKLTESVYADHEALRAYLGDAFPEFTDLPEGETPDPPEGLKE